MISETVIKPVATISQIVDKNGTPGTAIHTEALWVDKSETDVFSNPTSGNKIDSLTTGQEYFARLIQDCDRASSEIYITGWQVNWDALLSKNVRVYDLIYRCAARGVNIYVMPWDDTEPVQTFDDQTKIVLESINDRVAKAGGKGRVGQVFVELSPSYASRNPRYFSHHQKLVVVDRKVAFVGGIDLAYGRMDDNRFDLRADAEGREMMNRYNPGIPPLKSYKSGGANIVDPDLMVGALDRLDTRDEITGEVIEPSNRLVQGDKISAGAWQVRYGKAGILGTAPNTSTLASNTAERTTLDPSRQPRMPWQDVHCRIEGPAVFHLIRNFVSRWNIISRAKLDMAKSSNALAKCGNAKIQVLRSAPANHCTKENKANLGGKSAGTQQDIHIAMQNLVRKARHFIYIEQQFFVSDFGQIGGPQGKLSAAGQYIADGASGISSTALKAVRAFCKNDDFSMDRLPTNGVLKALLDRLREVILEDFAKPNFHVYITLPVHPEGALIDATIAVQVYYTMQTLVFGSNSLINGIKRLVKARELRDKNDLNYARVIHDPANMSYETVSDEECSRYVTLLNLRTWAKSGSGYITEQIYVHSKLMIVDDRFALLGSANINDRSLLGERDSELAVLVLDDDTAKANINGNGQEPVRTFAHELRKKIWTKLFGIAGDVRPANDLQMAIQQPGSPESWRKIQELSRRNASIYERIFDFIPRNFVLDKNSDGTVPASVIPNWLDDALNPTNPNKKGFPSSLLPCDPAFWKSPTHSPVAQTLIEIKGFITALPIGWTKGENLRILFPTPLVADQDGRDARERGRGDNSARSATVVSLDSERKA